MLCALCQGPIYVVRAALARAVIGHMAHQNRPFGGSYYGANRLRVWRLRKDTSI